MNSKDKHQINNSSEVRHLDRIHEIELEKLFERVISIDNLRIQVGSFFGTINLGALSFAFSLQKVVFFFFAAALFLLLILIDIRIRVALARSFFRIFKIKDKFLSESEIDNTVLFGYEGIFLNPNKYIDPDKGMKLTAYLSFFYMSALGFWLPITAFIIEIMFGFYFWLHLGWQLF